MRRVRAYVIAANRTPGQRAQRCPGACRLAARAAGVRPSTPSQRGSRSEGSGLSERVWDRFLSEQDRARAAAQPAMRKGGGQRPALLLVDLYREVFGDRPQPLLEAMEDWPNSCGLNGWEALPHIGALLH